MSLHAQVSTVGDKTLTATANAFYMWVDNVYDFGGRSFMSSILRPTQFGSASKREESSSLALPWNQLATACRKKPSRAGARVKSEWLPTHQNECPSVFRMSARVFSERVPECHQTECPSWSEYPRIVSFFELLFYKG
jgi:hypothetical protein